MPNIRKIAAAPAIAAALSLVATPASAAELSKSVVLPAIGLAPAWSPGDDDAQRHRHWRYRRDRGIDAGDVLAGVLIIGGIAAIANAAKNNDRAYRDRDWQYPRQRRGDYQYDDARGIDRAVSICVDEIERNARVEEVETVNRDARGWQVGGSLYDGEAFSCSIGEDGRIEAINYGRGARSYSRGFDETPDYDERYEARDDRQYDDDYYAQARARADMQTDTQPTYPGGPIDGGEIDADIEYGTGYQGVDG